MSEQTAERLAELRGIAEAATPGPWTNVDPKRGAKKAVYKADTATEREPVFGVQWGPRREYIANTLSSSDISEQEARANATHIATFDPPTVVALLDEIDTLRAKLDDLLSQRMDEAEAKLATRPAEAVVGELQAENHRLREGYRLLAEAVEAKAELDEAVEEYVKARQSPLQIDPERTNALGQRGIEMQTRYHQAQAKALAHLRGVGCD